MSLNQYKFGIIILMLLAICTQICWQQAIPSEQFKVNNFQEDIWHPHLEKSLLDDSNFVLVDTYKDHVTDSSEPNRLKSNDQVEQTKSALSSNFVTGDDSPNTVLPGRDPTLKGPFNWACKFTLADTPKYDTENYSILVNQNGNVDGGMLGEYVDIYDSNKDNDNVISLNVQQRSGPQTNNKSMNATNANSTSTSNRIQLGNSPSIQSDQNSTLNSQTPTIQSDSNATYAPPSIGQQGVIYNNLNNQPSFLQGPSTAQLVQQANMQPMYQQPSGYMQYPNQQQYIPQYPQQYQNQYQQPAYLQQPNMIPQSYIVQQPTVHPNTIQFPNFVQQPNFQTQFIQQQFSQPQYVQTSPNYVGFGLNQVPTLVYTNY